MRSSCAQMLLLGLIACGGVSPDPARMAEQLPDAVTVDADAAAANARDNERAVKELEDGDFEAARSLSEAVLNRDPRDGRARAIRATCLAQEARRDDPPDLVLWRRAEGELRRADELAPDDSLVALLHARFLQSDGHLSAAVTRVELLLESKPDDPEALRLAGELRYDIGDERAAIKHLSRLLGQYPDDAASTWRLADARMRLASVDPERAPRLEGLLAAAEGYRRYRELRPIDINGWLAEAYARYLSWEDLSAAPSDEATAEVLGLYAGAAEVAPDSPEPAFGRGVVLEYIADTEGAEQAYREALALDGGYLPGLLNLAALLADQGRAEEARDVVLQALQQDLPSRERGALEDFLRQDEG